MRFLRTMLRPIAKLIVRQLPVADPWEPIPQQAFFGVFGSSAPRFEDLLAGESSVRADSVESVCEWLLACEYADPIEGEASPHGSEWRHPALFEKVRRGDCTDFAVWAWRKLSEQGVDAHLFVGRLARNDCPEKHAWVVYHDADGSFLLEAVARSRSEMIRPLVDGKPEYIPYASVDRNGRRQLYAGEVVRLKQGLGA